MTPTDTMLCDACNTHLANRREMAEYQDPALRVDYRRSAAIILVSLARRRKRECANEKLSYRHGQTADGSERKND